MGDTELQSTKVQKELGVYVDEDLKFQQYISSVNQSSRMMWITKKTFSCLDEDTLPRLYKALVRPHLEYGNIVWHPHYQMDKLAEEKVQRQATKLVPYLKHLPYEQQLVALRFLLLLFRRGHDTDVPYHEWDRHIWPKSILQQSTQWTNYAEVIYSQRLFVGRCRLEIRKNSFSQRVVQDWNSLLDHIVTTTTPNSFKSRLGKHWKDNMYTTP